MLGLGFNRRGCPQIITAHIMTSQLPCFVGELSKKKQTLTTTRVSNVGPYTPQADFFPLYLLALNFLVMFSKQKLGALVKCKFGTLDLALRHGPVQTEAK